MVVITPSHLDPKFLGHRDLHVIDVASVPDRFEDPVGEAERQERFAPFPCPDNGQSGGGACFSSSTSPIRRLRATAEARSWPKKAF